MKQSLPFHNEIYVLHWFTELSFEVWNPEPVLH